MCRIHLRSPYAPPGNGFLLGACDANASHRLGTFGIGGAKRGPGPSPSAPPRARARPASYARLSLPHNIAVDRAAPGRRAPAANQSRTSNGHEAKAACARGLLLRPTTMRSDVTRSLRATSSLHLPHLVDHLAVSALARRALRPRRPRTSPLALFSFPFLTSDAG